VTATWQTVEWALGVDSVTLGRALTGRHFAIIRREERLDNRWSWAVLRKELPTCNALWVASGISDTLEQAQIAVGTWEQAFHRHALVLYFNPELHLWTYRCRACLGGNLVASTLAEIHRAALTDPDHEECDHAWQEEMVGVR
jgi:hypothetical protein